MKKFIVAIVMILVSLTSFAGHLKVLGVPIDGTITQFQARLQQKGCRYDKTVSGMLPNGARAFNGTFAGKKANIYAYYDLKSKIVYRVKICFTELSEQIAEQEYAEFKNMLSAKYGEDNMRTGEKDGKEAVSFFTPDGTEIIEGEECDVFNGMIDMFITKREDMSNYPYYYTLHIDYYDTDNNQKHENANLDDL